MIAHPNRALEGGYKKAVMILVTRLMFLQCQSECISMPEVPQDTAGTFEELFNKTG